MKISRSLNIISSQIHSIPCKPRVDIHLTLSFFVTQGDVTRHPADLEEHGEPPGGIHHPSHEEMGQG